MRVISRRLLSLILALSCLFALFPFVHGVSAGAYCLMDADTGEVLFSGNEDAPFPMASTTKIMTCYYAIREGDLHRDVKIPREAVGVEGSSVYLQEGETQKLSDLLYALMLQSANDAAVAIAIAVSGSVDAFVRGMNDCAKELGLANTRFSDPHGLSSDGHYASAKDLCILLGEAIKNDVFSEIIGTVKYRIPAPDGGERVLVNHNRLLRSYGECVGGKTGFTRAAGRCLVTAAKRNGKTLLCATLNAPDDWNDHKTLFEEGFSLYHEECFCRYGEIRQEIPVVGGETNTVTVTNLSSHTGMLKGDDPVRTVLELPRFLYAPVPGVSVSEDGGVLRRAGALVGYAVYYQGDREVARVPLYPTASVGAALHKKGAWEKIGDGFQSLWEWMTGLWKK